MVANTDETFFRTRRIFNLEACNKDDLNELRKWISRQGRGGCLLIRGIESQAWEKEYESDIAALSTGYEEKDVFSRWFNDKAITWYHNLMSQRLHDKGNDEDRPAATADLIEYSDEKIERCLDATAILLASLLPTLPFFVLYNIRHPVAQMGAIVGLAFLFSLVVKIFTRATRSEIFIATAGFTAVQIVFLGGSLCNVK